MGGGAWCGGGGGGGGVRRESPLCCIECEPVENEPVRPNGAGAGVGTGAGAGARAGASAGQWKTAAPGRVQGDLGNRQSIGGTCW